MKCVNTGVARQTDHLRSPVPFDDTDNASCGLLLGWGREGTSVLESFSSTDHPFSLLIGLVCIVIFKRGFQFGQRHPGEINQTHIPGQHLVRRSLPFLFAEYLDHNYIPCTARFIFPRPIRRIGLL
jgi:hypothetical protein